MDLADALQKCRRAQRASAEQEMHKENLMYTSIRTPASTLALHDDTTSTTLINPYEEDIQFKRVII